jgi:hypothetical protein
MPRLVFLMQWCIFFRPTGDYVRDNYSVLSIMAPVYYIVTVCVIWTSRAHVWRLHFHFLGMGYNSFSPNRSQWSSRLKPRFCRWPATRFAGPIYQYVIGTFNTFSQGPTHRSLTDIGGAYNLGCAGFPHTTPQPSQLAVSTFHLRVPPGLQLNQIIPIEPKLSFKEPMAAMWSSDHLAI